MCCVWGTRVNIERDSIKGSKVNSKRDSIKGSRVNKWENVLHLGWKGGLQLQAPREREGGDNRFGTTDSSKQ